MKDKRYYFLMVLTLVVGLFLRPWRLEAVPTGLHGDEVSLGYNASLILTTGKSKCPIPPSAGKVFEVRRPDQTLEFVGYRLDPTLVQTIGIAGAEKCN